MISGFFNKRIQYNKFNYEPRFVKKDNEDESEKRRRKIRFTKRRGTSLKKKSFVGIFFLLALIIYFIIKLSS